MREMLVPVGMGHKTLTTLHEDGRRAKVAGRGDVAFRILALSTQRCIKKRKAYKIPRYYIDVTMAITNKSTTEERRLNAERRVDETTRTSLHKDDLRAALNEFLGKTAAAVILNHIFPAGIKGDTLTNDELDRLKRELRELIGTQADLIISLIT